MPKTHGPILVLDDNRNMGQILAMVLREAGFHDVIVRESAAEAFTDIIARRPAAILTDWEMPEVDGLEFVRWLRRDPASPAVETPVILVSGYAHMQMVSAARDAGVNSFVAKPVTAKAIVQRLQAALEKPRPFVYAHEYTGPCRRTRVIPAYRGGLKRLADAAPESKNPADAIQQRRKAATLEALSRLADALDVSVGADVARLRDTAVDARAAAEAARDYAMADIAASLSRYVTAVGLSGRLDRDVVQMHVQAMNTLQGLDVRGDDQGFAIVDGLRQVVAKRLGRPAAAAPRELDSAEAVFL